MAFNSKFSIRSILSLDEDTNSTMEVDQQTSSINFTANKNCSVKSSDNEQRPPYTYSALILMAIQKSPEKRLTLSGICDWISENFPYYQKNKTVWHGSIRHNLSLNSFFVRSTKSLDKSVRGHYWTLSPSAEDVTVGGADGRMIKRRKGRDARPYSPAMREKSRIPTGTELNNQQKKLGYQMETPISQQHQSTGTEINNNQQTKLGYQMEAPISQQYQSQISQRTEHSQELQYQQQPRPHLATPAEMMSIWNYVYYHQYQMMLQNSSSY